MPKLTYVLTLFGHGKHPSPVPICGWLQPAPYGYAEYDVALNTHVLRVPQEQWEGGMAADLAQKIKTHMDQWIVTAEVEPDPDSPDGKLLQEIEALMAENEMLQQQVKEASAPRQVPLPRIEPPAEAPQPEQAADQIPDFGGMGLDALEKEVEKSNAEGPLIEITGYRTKVKLREALTTWWAAKLTAKQ